MKVIYLLIAMLATFISTAAETNSSVRSLVVDANALSNAIARLRAAGLETNRVALAPARGRALAAFASTNSLQLSNAFERILILAPKTNTNMEAIEVVSLEPIFKRSLGMDVVFNASVTRDCATIVYGNSEFMYGYEYGTGCPSPHSDYFFTTNITGKLKVFIQKLESER